MAYYITGDCHAHFEKLVWLARFNKKLGKEDAKEGYGTVEWVDDHGTLGQEKEVSYDIVKIERACCLLMKLILWFLIQQ